MRIAISTDGEYVASHFGRCPEYTIVDVENGEIKKDDLIQNPGHSPGFLPKFLSEMGVNCIITGGMGRRAQDLFAQFSIETIVGVSGTVIKVIEDFMKGQLAIGESQCDHGKPSHRGCEERK
jgi:predicted Fe-Mo cluster-binding NifX family protein